MTESVLSPKVSTRDKLIFWLFLGGLSAVSAEIISSATLFPFFPLWGVLVVLPSYGLHVLVLAYLNFRGKRVTVTTLFLTGAIFGLYEAYLTKVLWNPTWGEWTLQFGGVYIIQTIVLVLFWHPLMAYIVPVFIAENFLTLSSETLSALPKRLRDALGTKSGWKRFVILSALYFSLCKSFSAENALLTFLSSAVNIGILIGLGWWWNKIRAGRELTFHDVLPSKKEFNVLAFLLLAMYVGMGLFIRPEALPHTLIPHLTIWIMYTGLFVLLYFNLKRTSEITAPPQPAPFRGQAFRTGIIWLIVLSLLPVLLLPVKIIVIILILLSWVVGCTAGAILLVRSTRVLFYKNVENSATSVSKYYY